ncbi:DUF3768 domain-containing protein [Ferrovibrio sp.]|uniref:DUF3768 domain-containing protein n=1 Tax=Ferrovibrio sp. TaxID=1917215 RepID=UPI000CB4DF87|nr:DUF3768 domain-containing protein [Ferrovibrio sp.]PJI42551.1 MAG: hypothetical protein CTR53_07175 [Ferrovibrio sp.]
MNKTDRIRELNDAFRRTMLGGRFVITNGVRSLGQTQLSKVVQLVQAFDAFEASNDPHQEHDFGSVDFDGKKIFWKIDYYDRQLKYGSENPANPAITMRVMTIMLAEEY